MSRAGGSGTKSPYLVTVRPHVCRCTLPAHELSRHRIWDNAVKTAAGYWNIYAAFYGQYQLILWFEIIDVRDGKVLWRNGKPTQRRSSGDESQATTTG